ncbi:MAG TPA: hypothetical protein VGB77_19075 [Abditibacteriaceae bacterium]|jgi:hypothetical protein
MKREELFWMLLPCLLLLAGAFYYAKRETHENAPWQIFVAKAEPMPLLPREVAEGFDTKWQITLKERGKRPLLHQQMQQQATKLALFVNLVTIHRKSDNKKLDVSSAFEINGKRNNGPSQQDLLPITFLTSLAGVPKSDGTLLLRADIGAYQWAMHNPKTPQATFTRSKKLSLPLIVQEVRQEGQVVRIPEVSRDCPLALIKAEAVEGRSWWVIGKGKPTGTWQINATVKFNGSLLAKRNRPQFRWVDSYVEDEKGRRIKLKGTNYFLVKINTLSVQFPGPLETMNTVSITK